MPTFSVPAGCRQAMTDLHKAHSERFDRVKNTINQMKVNQKEDHRLIAAFMDTHNVMRNAIQHTLKNNGDVISDTSKSGLEAAKTHGDDISSSLIRGHRGAGIGRATVSPGKPVGKPMAGRKVDPQTHLLKVISDIRSRYPEKDTGPK